MFKRLSLLLIVISVTLPLASYLSAETSGTDDANLPQPEVITYVSDGLSLKGYVYKPAGNGPFPAYLWNHGSDKAPSPGRKLAKFWLDHGFVFFAPIRHGHGDNPGTWIVDEEKALRASGQGPKRVGPQIIKLHDK